MKFHLRPAASRQEENVLCDFERAREGTSYQNMHAQFSVVSTSAQHAPGGGGPLPITPTAVYQTSLNSCRGQDVSLFVDDTFSYFRHPLPGARLSGLATFVESAIFVCS